MNCPTCHKTLTPRKVAEAEVYECPACRGLWLPRGQLDAVKNEVLPDLTWLDMDAWKAQTKFVSRESPLPCPSCNDVAMATIEDRSSRTEVDMCPKCRGTWLGTGQYLNLVNALLEEANRIPAPEYARIGLERAKDMLTHPREITSDWEALKIVLGLFKKRLLVENPTLESILVGIEKSLPL